MANQINIYDNEHYLDHIADKWRKMGYITPGMPTYAAYSFAFSYEHPNEGAQNRITNLTNFIRAHAARAGNTGTVVHAYSIAYGSNIPVTYGISEEVTIPDAYGTSAANIDTRPKVRDRKAEHAFRAALAYPDGNVPPSVLPRKVTQCAEMMSLPRAIESIRHFPHGTPIVITSLTMDFEYGKKSMCRNCEGYANRMVEGRLGLCIIDAATHPGIVYESADTRRLWGNKQVVPYSHNYYQPQY
ncbi:hypothetical protein BDZ97DRAFT_1442229 [Flammula alnicola]|nr:hypothetical protein BDZ97DRAFT_1442229 [Flammula alnicola]